jgi:tetratricopeptide (TPR) repeat protein
LGEVAQATASLNAVIGASGTSDEQAAECLEYLAYMAQNANDAAMALKYGNLALVRLRRSPHPSQSIEANFIGSVGFAEYLNGRNAEAERDYAAALEMFARAGREHSANAIAVRNNWGIVSDGAGDSKRALEIFEQTLQIVLQDNGRAQVPPYLVANLARQLENVGRYEDCLVGLASVSVSLGDTQAAAGYLDKASAAGAGAVPARSPAALALMLTKGRLALERGDAAEARAALTSVIAGQRPIATTVRALLTRSDLNLREVKLTDAADDARQALAISQTLQGGIAYSNRTGLAWLMIGRVLGAQGETQSAHEAFRMAAEHLSHTVDATYPALLEAQRQLTVAEH